MPISSDLQGNLRDVTRLVTMWTHVEVWRDGAAFGVTIYTAGGDRQALTLRGSYPDMHYALSQALAGLDEEGRALDPSLLNRG